MAYIEASTEVLEFMLDLPEEITITKIETEEREDALIARIELDGLDYDGQINAQYEHDDGRVFLRSFVPVEEPDSVEEETEED